MTDPSQYFRGRTVQEQMNEVIGYVDVRSAEVATDAIAADVAQVHSDAADAHADALAAAASAAAAAGTLTNAVKKTGEASQSIDGDIDLNDDLNVDGDVTVGGALTVTGAVTVPTPVNNTDAATKKYVDDADALKMNIADINQYAVGLTGNQPTVAGFKGFSSSVSIPPALRSGNDVHTLILSFAQNASTNYIFDLCVSNKRSLTAGRFVVTTAADKTIASVSWASGFSTGTPRCKVGAYTASDVLYVTIAGTEGGSYNAVNLLGAIVGDGYPLNATFAARDIVTAGADYQGVVIS